MRRVLKSQRAIGSEAAASVAAQCHAAAAGVVDVRPIMRRCVCLSVYGNQCMSNWRHRRDTQWTVRSV